MSNANVASYFFRRPPGNYQKLNTLFVRRTMVPLSNIRHYRNRSASKLSCQAINFFAGELFCGFV